MKMIKFLSWAMIILIVASVFGVTVSSPGNKDDLKVEAQHSKISRSINANLIEIKNWHDLDDVRNDLSAEYGLSNDLDKNSEGYDELVDTENGWEPIGEFKGTFIGQGYEIRDLYIDRPEMDNVGLFNRTAEQTYIAELDIVDLNITGDRSVGGLVGHNSGSISDSNSKGSVKGEDYSVGGLVGKNSGSIESSHAEGKITGDENVGGLAGIVDSKGIVKDSSASSEVIGNRDIGGLVGQNIEGSVSSSYSTGDVNGENFVGGLIGHNDGGDVSESFATGDVTGNISVGGLVGANTISFEERNRSNVSKSYATGSVSGDSRIGGLIGYNDEKVSKSYAAGEVTGQEYVGGLVGVNDPGGEIKDSFSNSVTTNQEKAWGFQMGDASNLDALPTEDMIKKETFADSGWDICSVESRESRDESCTWNIIDGETHPFFNWQEEIEEIDENGDKDEDNGSESPMISGIGFILAISLASVAYKMKREDSDESELEKLLDKKGN